MFGNVEREILSALGLVGRRVTSLTLRFQHNKPVSIEVERLVSEDEIEGIKSVLEHYTLEAKIADFD